MLIKKINLKDVFPRKMSGRDIFDLINKDILGASKLSMEITKIEPGQVLKPCHSHKAEEVAYVISGEGRVWVDGMMADLLEEDAILWPSGSKHCLKNSGKKQLILLCTFSTPEYQKDYKNYEEITPFL